MDIIKWILMHYKVFIKYKKYLIIIYNCFWLWGQYDDLALLEVQYLRIQGEYFTSRVPKHRINRNKNLATIVL